MGILCDVFELTLSIMIAVMLIAGIVFSFLAYQDWSFERYCDREDRRRRKQARECEDLRRRLGYQS